MFNSIACGFSMGLALAAAVEGRGITAAILVICACLQIPAMWLAKINAESA